MPPARAEDRERLERAIEVGAHAVGVAPHRRAEQQVLGDREACENVPAFGNERDPLRHHVLERDAGERLAGENDAARGHGTMPAMAETSEVLPAPFGPTMLTISPAPIARSTPRTAVTAP